MPRIERKMQNVLIRRDKKELGSQIRMYTVRNICNCIKCPREYQ